MHYMFGQYELDTGSRTLRHAGESVEIQSKAFDVLAYLIERRERFVSPDELLDAFWPDVHVTPAAVSAAVRKARRAVGDDGGQQAVLRTKHGQGFRFVADLAAMPAKDAASPTRSRFRVHSVPLASVAALILVAVAAWLVIRPLAGSAPTRSVAVLPFANMSQDAAAEPFANGIYEDILTQISKIRDLKVIARTTMERLEPNLGVREIGNQLGVAAVLEGGVQRAGDRIRINVQLNDCETETHIWAETYDRRLTATNIFAIQSEIAASVADALKAELTSEEQGQLAIAPTENLAAYQAYLHGHQRLSKNTNAATTEAITYFQHAIELDGSYARAHVGLADSYIRKARWSNLPFEETLAKALAAAEKALALDDRLGEAHASLALIKKVKRDFVGAEAEFRRALELSPNYATAYDWYGILLRVNMGRTEEALAMHLRAAELDPLSSVILLHVAEALESQGQFDEALSWYERAFELNPMMDSVNAQLGLYHWRVTGKLDHAVSWFRRAISIDPDYYGSVAPLGAVMIDLGDAGAAEYWFERAITIAPENIEVKAIQIDVAFLHLCRGDEPAAVEQARKALEDFPRNSDALLLLRNHELRSARYVAARTLYEEAYPGLLYEDEPKVGRGNWSAAIDLALVLLYVGERERADLLLEKSLRHIQTKPRLGKNGYGIADVEIFALRGDKEKALAALREAVDAGWRSYWWYYFEHEPSLESLRDEPEFQAMVAEIKADMAAQLARVREMERRGELVLSAELPAPMDYASVRDHRISSDR